MKHIDAILDRFTMYQVVITVLSVWAGAAVIFSFFELVVGTPVQHLLTLFILGVSGTISHFVFQQVWRAPANFHSTIITLLILYFLFMPASSVSETYIYAGIGVLAIATKYIFVWNKLHIFNPVALTAVVMSLSTLAYASWWIATPVMFPLVAIGGWLIVMKINREVMVLSSLFAALAMFVLIFTLKGSYDASALQFFFIGTPLLFFLTVMLTEPLSTPGTKKLQILYGIVVGALFSTPFVIGPVGNTPELSLLIANFLFYPFSLRQRLVLTLTSIKEVARNTKEYAFVSQTPFSYKAGQYLEWSLPHPNADGRGVRRYFTIASAPTEKEVRLAVRYAPNGSSFKKRLQSLRVGENIYATARAGDFVLPQHPETKKYLFIAGGIGVTPFRAIVKELLDTNKKLDIVMFYLNRSQSDIAYNDLFVEAKRIGLVLVPVLDSPEEEWKGEKGFITSEMLQRHASDVAERVAYISGPPRMVGAYKALLKKEGLPSHHIMLDYFPGLA